MRKCISLFLVFTLAVMCLFFLRDFPMMGENWEYHRQNCEDLRTYSDDPDLLEAALQDEFGPEYFDLQGRRGFAVFLHPDGLDASGWFYGCSYETADGGRSWHLADENFCCNRGEGDLVCVGDAILIASDQPKGDFGVLEISYDRGRTWEDSVLLHDLLCYDNAVLRLIPTILNSNGDTGIVTIGWRDGNGVIAEPNFLITQFDVNRFRFTEILYCHPDADIRLPG